MKNVILEHLYHKPLIDPAELLNTLHEYRDMIAPFVCDVSVFLDKALKEGKTILLEGQLGTMKDPDHGIYPMVTSSSTLAAYGAIGAGIPPYEIKQIVTVSKAYSSAVGAGAFVSGPVRLCSYQVRLSSAGRYRCSIYRTGCTGISGGDPCMCRL